MRLALVLLVVATVVANADVVRADDAHADDAVASAKAEASAAEQLASSQKYVEAAAKFRAAYRLDAKPEYLCNVGVAYHRAKELPRAQIYLGECLRLGQTMDAQFLDLVRQALAEVETKLRAGDFAPVSIKVTPDGARISIDTFDADETFIGSQVVWLPFGHHTISATADGYDPEKQTIDVDARTQRELPLDLKRSVSQPKTITTPRSKAPAIVSTAVTLGLAGAAVATFLHARSIMDTAKATTIDHDEYTARIDSARNWQHASWALGAAAGAGAVISTLLWVRSSGSSSTTVEVSPTPGGGAVSFSASW